MLSKNDNIFKSYFFVSVWLHKLFNGSLRSRNRLDCFCNDCSHNYNLHTEPDCQPSLCRHLCCSVFFGKTGGIGITCSGSGRQFKLNSVVHYVLLETWRGHYFNFVLYSVPPLILCRITKLIEWQWPLV